MGLRRARGSWCNTSGSKQQRVVRMPSLRSALGVLFAACSLLSGCLSTSTTDECKLGTETCGCLPDDTCERGLSCRSEHCVDLPTGDAGERALDGVDTAGGPEANDDDAGGREPSAFDDSSGADGGPNQPSPASKPLADDAGPDNPVPNDVPPGPGVPSGTPGVCTVGDAQCVSAQEIQRCGTGERWTPVEPCAFVCADGACSGECEPGDRKCDGLVRMWCDDAGAWQTLTACSGACELGVCTGLCEPGEGQCATPTQFQWCETGGVWGPAAPCEFSCVDGACGGECRPGTKECLTSGRARECSQGGTWLESDCPYACIDGSCGGSCTPGQTRCNGITREQQCAEAGTWQDSAECAFVCLDVACGGECVPGERRCLDLQPQLCNSLATWVDDGSACELVCAAGVCSGSCTPGATQCSSNTTLQTCTAAAEWDTGTECPFTCASGACGGVCKPGDVRCSTSPGREQCGATGAWEALADCDISCVGAGSCGECVPGDMTCVDAVLRSCGGDGAWADQITCSGTTSECSAGQCRAPATWIDISAGTGHVCALRDDGTAWCWGHGEFGGLGYGGWTKVQSTPIQVRAALGASETHWDDWTQMSAGRNHTCGIREDNSAWCWGSNLYNELGFGGEPNDRSLPHQVVAAGESEGGAVWTDWTRVFAGGGVSCGIRSDKSLWCWGGGSAQDLSSPRQILAAGETTGGAAWFDWTSVALGVSYICGLRENGTVWCWGTNSVGQLGNGSTDNSSTPSQVLANGELPGGVAWNDWTAIAGGRYHACGLRSNGTAWCWGTGFSGLGDGTTGVLATTPRQVLAAGEPQGGATWNDWIDVSGSLGESTCGMRSDGTVWCWGLASSGLLGNGTSSPNQTTPSQVLATQQPPGGTAWSDWSVLSKGNSVACALRTDGSLWCWGQNLSGQTGCGDTLRKTTPVRVVSP